MKTREYGITWHGPTRWHRVFVSVGPAVFLRRGFWRTRTDTIKGVNVRIGKSGLGVPSVLALAHSRPKRDTGPKWSWHHAVHDHHA